jgi:cyclophilin family peptidyl-prolyl cis-trans isomerase
MSDSNPRSPNRLLMEIGAGVVLAAAVVAVALGVNRASTVGTTPPIASSSAAATPAASASASASTSAAPVSADCSAATFGATLQPLNPPADVHVYPAAPPMTIDTTKLYQATITTAKGNIVLCLAPQLAPVTVNNFVTLARNHYYDGIPFHRVVASFVVQGGDPSCVGNVPAPPATPSGGCGMGGPGYSFKDEPVRGSYTQGCVAMANSGPNTNGSQFFICIADDSTKLQPLYNLFGNVLSGGSVALQIAQGDVMQSITVQQQQ